MKLILKKAHSYLYVISVTLFYFSLYPFLWYYSHKPADYKHMNKLRRLWGFLSSACVGIFYKFTYEVPIDRTKTYIICPNHTSNLDISAMCLLVKSDCSFMGKEELTEGIVTSLFFRTVDIPVNRDSKMSSFRAFKKAIEKLHNGITMIIFPEGKIGDDYPPTLHPFKNGPFRLAIEAGVPIVPVTSTNTWKMLWDTGTKHGSKPGICNIFVHKPIETNHLTADDADSLRDEVYRIMQQKFEEQ
ncbi:MAG TPA: lysophospholipid acyltransferase family protein [Mucilaginibacter sp.]|jgi:1-acyl-sn-glycerol-3-phosphate acyltransferase|nr:lysophospholipid acyltransferase family protein [Mucilaginibacter sp.]